jgi:hypothetical protein
MTNEPQELDRSYNVSHQEFVSGVQTGRVSLRVDGPGAYPFAASWSGAIDFASDKPILFLDVSDLIAMQESRDVLAAAFPGSSSVTRS